MTTTPAHSPATSELTTLDQIGLRLAFVKFVAAAVKAAEVEAKKAAAKLMHKGDTIAVRSPLDDTKLARFTMSDPGAVAEVTDPTALDEWVREHYADKVRKETTVIGSHAEVVAVLQQHAPDLLTRKTAVPGWVINEMVTRSQGAGEPVGPGGECGDDAPPGITVTKPPGVLSVTTNKDAIDAFRALWDAHIFSLDGTVQLPGGTS